MSKTTGYTEPEVRLSPKSVLGFHNLDYDKCDELIERLKELGIDKDFDIELVPGEDNA